MPGAAANAQEKTAQKMQWNALLEYSSSFAMHYLLCLLCGVAFAVMEFCVKPKTDDIEFSTLDPTIAKTFKPHELVGNGSCLFIAAGVPLLAITGYCVYGRKMLKKHKKTDAEKVHPIFSLWHTSLLALCAALTLNGALTCFLKLVIANPRPDFISRCQPVVTRQDDRFSLSDCTQTDIYTLYDGLRSTPSGHSSFALAGLGYLYMWQTRFICGNKTRHLWCPLLIVLVMLSRVVDHKHRWSDLVYGGLVGLASLGFAWTQIVRPQLALADSWQLPRPVTQA